ncbi:MAG: lipid-A-disaccharide synthase [Candidatus Marinimicrobia bacterium]|nr:lipid-A-disaccharide synthase [Candidatus Neomarinimicrobiota bacterium]
MASKHIFISAGELSGDIHGGNLVTAIRTRQPEINISAIGGDNMSSAGATLLYHIRETSFMGFAEVLRHLPFIYRLWKKTLRHIDQIKPDLVVLIDYPGFNLRLAKAVTKRNIPVIYYISPQVWAWHQSRVKKIKKFTQIVLCILPFEENWLKKHGVNAHFVGHPLRDQIEKIHKFSSDDEEARPDYANPYIGLFPGSRRQEVQRHLPIMLETVHRLKKFYPALHAAISIAPDMDMTAYEKQQSSEWIHWLKNRNHRIMQNADLLIMSSGTATLEASLFQTPLIVIYRLSPISFLLGKILVKVPYISLANLIANRKGITELIQHEANPDNIVHEADKVLSNSEYRAQMIQFLKEVNQQLGKPGTSDRVAEIILGFL